MTETIKIGNTGEDLAEQHLIQQGYIIRERNYRAFHKEIDIIAEDGDVLAFIEVKYYKKNSLRDLHFAVDKAKQRNIVAAARHYLAKHEIIDRYTRFDVVLIEQDGPIELYKDAFRA